MPLGSISSTVLTLILLILFLLKHKYQYFAVFLGMCECYSHTSGIKGKIGRVQLQKSLWESSVYDEILQLRFSLFLGGCCIFCGVICGKEVCSLSLSLSLPPPSPHALQGVSSLKGLSKCAELKSQIRT